MAAAANPKKTAADVPIGSRLRIHWPLDQMWYKGTVTGFDDESGRHMVTYDDGEVEQVDLNQEEVYFLEVNAKGKKPGSAAVGVHGSPMAPGSDPISATGPGRKRGLDRVDGAGVPGSLVVKLQRKVPENDAGAQPADGRGVPAAAEEAVAGAVVHEVPAVRASPAPEPEPMAVEVAGAGAGAHDPFFSLLGSATAAVDARFEQESRALLTGRPAGAGGLRGLASRMCASPGVVTPGGTERAAKAQWLRLYAKANAAAVRKIMKKYRKTHGSQEGAAPQVGAVRSPMMVELWAVAALDGGVEGGDGTADELKLLEPLFAEKMRKVLEQDEADADDLLCCCVCMDFVVDATALGCGHVYCELCAKRVAGVPPFAELCEAPETATCPMCRKPGVFGSAERLKNVDKLAQKQVTPREWKERKEFVRHEARTTGIRMIKA
mmetsp:Transcript_2433/g.8617  ORF Transcript_2433/g.8617 Transcript_2433/m.8617 type:complete len:436 (-) Transcript_2433:107-1414(-)